MRDWLLKIVIEGPPIAKKRHKCACRGRHAIAYDPQVGGEMETVKRQMLMAWHQAWESGDSKIVRKASNLTKAQSFDVTYTFLFPINKSDTLGQKNAKLWGFQSHNVKPDKDNLEKLYSDCGKGIFWSDDCQITIGASKKYYSENPRTEIEIMVKEDLKLGPNAESVFLVFGPERLKEFLYDIHASFLWIHPEHIDDLLPMSEEPDKEQHFHTLAKLLTNFSAKYCNDLKKIQKIKIEDSNEQEVVQAIEEGKFNI